MTFILDAWIQPSKTLVKQKKKKSPETLNPEKESKKVEANPDTPQNVLQIVLNQQSEVKEIEKLLELFARSKSCKDFGTQTESQLAENDQNSNPAESETPIVPLTTQAAEKEINLEPVHQPPDNKNNQNKKNNNQYPQACSQPKIIQ